MTESTRERLVDLWDKRPECKPDELEYAASSDETGGGWQFELYDIGIEDREAELLAEAQIVRVLLNTDGLQMNGAKFDGVFGWTMALSGGHIALATGTTVLDSLISAAQANGGTTNV